MVVEVCCGGGGLGLGCEGLDLPQAEAPSKAHANDRKRVERSMAVN
jgi:hypothetical protein